MTKTTSVFPYRISFKGEVPDLTSPACQEAFEISRILGDSVLVESRVSDEKLRHLVVEETGLSLKEVLVTPLPLTNSYYFVNALKKGG